MGVSGFLISCATCRAISPQARTRAVRTSAVTSSSATTAPRGSSARPSAAAAAAARCGRSTSSSVARLDRRPSARTRATRVGEGGRAAGRSRGSGSPTAGAAPRISLARGFTSSTRPAASSASTPVAASATIVSVRRVSRTSAARARLQPPHHAVEGAVDAAELVRPLLREPHAQVARRPPWPPPRLSSLDRAREARGPPAARGRPRARPRAGSPAAPRRANSLCRRLISCEASGIGRGEHDRAGSTRR